MNPMLAALAGSAASRWGDAIDGACARYDISTRDRQAMFLSQCAHESALFTRVVENLNYSPQGLLATWPRRFTPEEAVEFAHDAIRIAERVYGGRNGNGPEGVGDGYRYRGRGLIQITGLANYAATGAALALKLTLSPELLETPQWAALSAAYFWATHGCNELADAGDFDAITVRINGGRGGAADRLALLDKAQAVA